MQQPEKVDRQPVAPSLEENPEFMYFNGFTVTTIINRQIENLLTLMVVASVLCIVFTTMSLSTIVLAFVFIVALVKLISLKMVNLRKNGLLHRLSEKTKFLLLEKSIFDIYSDLLYFPLVSKIIGAFIKPVITKPHPHQLKESFAELPISVQEKIARKGILSLAPNSVQTYVLSEEKPENLPEKFGQPQWEWYNYQKYDNHDDKVHEKTLGKQLVSRIDQKVSWTGFSILLGLVGWGLFSMRPSKIKKVLIQNGCFSGAVLITIVALVKLRKYQERREALRKAEKMAMAILPGDKE